MTAIVSSVPKVPNPVLLVSGGQHTETPAALDLVRLPIVLAMRKRPGLSDVSENAAAELDDDALLGLPILPADLYETRYEYVDRFGARHRVSITGHNRLGLPYGQDGGVLLALFKLLDGDRQQQFRDARARVRDGELEGVSLVRIARAMGYPEIDGRIARRIRGALRRLAHVRIQTSSTEFVDATPVVEALASGEPAARPLLPARHRSARSGGEVTAPGRVGRVVREEEVTWVLEYRWRSESRASGEASTWIRRLRVNPLWCNQALGGWVAWIDVGLYGALGGPLAKRLYELCAAEAAYGTPAPWTFDLEALRAACAMSPRRYANDVVRSLVHAAGELREHGILADVAHRKLKKGEHELTLTPGPVLLMPMLLRGTGAGDLRESRTQYAFLQAFGVDAAAARAMIDTDPAAVHHALLYALFVRDTDPKRVARSWGRMIEERVRNRRTNAGIVGFDEWLARFERGETGADAPRPAADAAGATDRSVDSAPDPRPPMRPCPVEPRSPIVAELWERVRDAMLEDEDPFIAAYVGTLVPFDTEGDVLVLVTDALVSRATQERALGLIAAALSSTPGDAEPRVAATVRIESYSPAQHAPRAE